MKTLFLRPVCLVILNFLYLLVASFAFATALPSYKIVDLGVLSADCSMALAVNEKGEIMGELEEGGYKNLFLWTESEGIKLIELPKDVRWVERSTLNNYGQIAAVCGVGKNASKLVFWDAHLGLWELDSSDGVICLIGFNDIGQILFRDGDKVILWERGTKINLTEIFRKQHPEEWSSLQASALNNRGHIAFSVSKKEKTKLFIWDGHSFDQVLREITDHSSVEVKYLDDDGNMIVRLYDYRNVFMVPPEYASDPIYFFNPSKALLVRCMGHGVRIFNGWPVVQGCLPGELKTDREGMPYFSKGPQIRYLLPDSFTRIIDQNARGYVVGQTDNLFGSHAFLAIPNNSGDDEL